MARPATGQVVRRETTRGRVYALRFRAYGKRQYVTLGRAEDGYWTEQRAERELAVMLRDVDLGIWKPPAPEPAERPETDPTFHVFASEWFADKAPEIRPNTVSSYRNDLTNHLLPFFKDHRLSEISVAEVDRYRQTKVREAAELAAAIADGNPRAVKVVDGRGRTYVRIARPLSNRSINMHISLLAQILALAVDHGQLERNSAAGRRRRLKTIRPRPVHLDTAEHLAVLLEAARAIDETDGSRATSTGRRAVVAVLMLAGLRAEELGALRWRDVDLANGRLEVVHAKTGAGVREVDLLPLLREILTEHKAASSQVGPDDPVFVTSRSKEPKPRDRHNVRQRVVEPAVKRADELLAERGGQPLPEGLSPHKLRHTFASLLVALGRDPAYVMGQLGHTDPAFTLRVYTHMMRRDEGERERLKGLVEGHATESLGTDWALDGSHALDRPMPESP